MRHAAKSVSVYAVVDISIFVVSCLQRYCIARVHLLQLSTGYCYTASSVREFVGAARTTSCGARVVGLRTDGFTHGGCATAGNLAYAYHVGVRRIYLGTAFACCHASTTCQRDASSAAVVHSTCVIVPRSTLNANGNNIICIGRTALYTTTQDTKGCAVVARSTSSCVRHTATYVCDTTSQVATVLVAVVNRVTILRRGNTTVYPGATSMAV